MLSQRFWDFQKQFLIKKSVEQSKNKTVQKRLS